MSAFALRKSIAWYEKFVNLQKSHLHILVRVPKFHIILVLIFAPLNHPAAEFAFLRAYRPFPVYAGAVN